MRANRVICCIQGNHVTELNWRSGQFVLNYKLAEDAHDLGITFRHGYYLSSRRERLPGLLLLRRYVMSSYFLLRMRYPHLCVVMYEYITASKQQASVSHRWSVVVLQ
jgi:hypothetical protein